MTFSKKFMSNSPFRQEENPKNEDNLQYTNKKESGMSDAEYAKYFGEGSIHKPNLEEVDLGVVNANKKIGESFIMDTSKGSSFPVGASTETIKQWYANNPPRDTVEAVAKGKKGLSGMKEAGGEFIQSLKTIAGNPFDAARAIVRTDDSGGDFPTSVQDLTALRELADRDDGSESSEQAKSVLSPSAGFNVASAMAGPALTAQTFLDLATGDPTAAVLGKAKKLPKVAKTLKKTKFGQQLESTILPSLYVGYKAGKQGKKIG